MLEDDSPDARAVEVVAMLGDSIVGVKHCMDPSDRKVRRASWALIAVGVAALVACGFAFQAAVDNAAYNQGRYDYETSVLGKPALSVHSRRLPRGYSWMALGGLLASVVTWTAAFMRMRKERESSFVRIGTAPGVDFPVGHEGDFAMIEPQGDHFAFRFGHGMDGEICTGGASMSLAELAAQQQGRTTVNPIPADAKIRAHVGATTFLVSSVERPRRHAVPLFEIDRPFARSLTGTAVVFGFLLLVLFQIPVEDDNRIEVLSIEEPTITRIVDQEPPPPPEIERGTEADDESGGTGTSMAFDAGTMGRKDSDRVEGQYTIEKTMPTPQLARQQAIEQARNAGILGSTGLVTGGAFASLTGIPAFSTGFDDTNIYGGKIGDEAGEMKGGFGYARTSFGPGGGGTGWGTICAGEFGTIGHGKGTGTGYGIGGGRCGTTCRGHEAATPTVSIGQPDAIGDFDKAIIRRYIKRNLDKITYCYEKRLLAVPGLSGTVATQFFITPSGVVASASATGVDDEVASCVADVLEGIQFPRPRDGGGVQVSYPFTLHSAGP